MAGADRIRVLIAGDVADGRGRLVRRVLEENGYAVLDDASTADAAFRATRAGQPDVVLLDEDLTSEGATVSAIRVAAPDCSIVVFASREHEAWPHPGADATLGKRVAVAALTARLGRLLAEQTVSLVEVTPPYVAAGRSQRPSER